MSTHVYANVCTHIRADMQTCIHIHVYTLTTKRIQDFPKKQLAQGVGEGEPKMNPEQPESELSLNHMTKTNIGNKGTKWHLVAADPLTRRAECHFWEARHQCITYRTYSADTQPRTD